MSSITGAHYNKIFDQKRLTGQIKRVFDCMKDGTWRTLSEIERVTGDPPASISAQLRNLRKEAYGEYLIDVRRRGEPTQGLFEYRLKTPLPNGQLTLF